MSGSASETSTASDQTEATDGGDLYLLADGKYVILARRWKHGEQTGLTADGVYERMTEGKRGVPDLGSENLAKMLVNGEMQQLSNPPQSQSPSSETATT